MNAPLSCSIIIPSFQSAETIAYCLSGVFNQQVSLPFEVIVVDSSSDATSDIVRREFPQVKLISLPRQTYPGTARNLGVQQARGEILIFLDSDCIPAPGWLARIIQAHQTGHTIVGGAVINGVPHSAVGWAGYISEFREFIPQGQPRQVHHIPTCNISYRAAVWAKYGGFSDEHYPQEDLLFNWALSKQGEKIHFDPAITVAHKHRTRLSAFLRHQQRIGAITAKVLRCTDLPGSNLARKTGLALLSLPLMIVVKFFRTLNIFWGWDKATVWKKPGVWGLVALGLLYWAFGFAQGLKSPTVAADSIYPFSQTIKEQISV